MKKFLIGIVILIILITILGGVFFLIDKAEYFSKGETIFTIDEDMGEGLTRKIGLGYIMYTRSTGFPTSEYDNIITSWFNAIKREQAIEILLKEDVHFENLNKAENQLVKYYSYLIMASLNKESEKFNIADTNTILINFNDLEDLKTGDKISQSEITALEDTLIQKLNNPNIKIENSNIENLERDKKIQSVLVQGTTEGIYVGIKKNDDKAELEVEIVQQAVEFFKSKISEKLVLRYAFDLNLIDNSKDGNIFTEIE